MKILVIQQKMIGDVLVSSIICNNLRSAYPNAQIDYLIYPFTAPVVENNPNINRILLFKDQYRTSKKALFQFLLTIRKEQYDLVMDAYGKVESRLVVAIENRLNLLNPLHLDITLDNRPKIFLTDIEIAKGKEILSQHEVDLTKKVYMIGVLGSGTNKTYPFPYMSAVLDAIVAQTGATLLFNYMPSQQKEAQEIFDFCQPNTQRNIKITLIPGSIREFLSITYHCNALIGNEGGAVNMAKAMNKPTFTIFSTWIIKEAWSFFEDGKTHVSVHLKDFKPELYGAKSAKEMKQDALELYHYFTPDLWLSELENYLQIN